MRQVSALELKSIPLFATLSLEELENVAKHTIAKVYEKGSALFFEGMEASILHIILRGSVSIYKTTTEGEVELNVLRRGEYLGEVTFADSQPRSASARVQDEAELLVVTKDAFEKILAHDARAANKLLLHFLKVLAQRLRKAEARCYSN